MLDNGKQHWSQWATLGALVLNLMGMLYQFGRLTQRVDDIRDQLNRLETLVIDHMRDAIKQK